ncbi:MAG: peptidoglycan editing factor PgeF [Polyangiaceae bacterium]|nr:peptidoglycan editing factor PgeF [Polyangiaceae bacterium]
MTATDPADFLESPVLRRAGFRHAFFTRKGGVSTGPFATLNFSRSVGDAEANVEANLERAAATLGVPRANLFLLTQVHSAIVVELGPGDVATNTAERSGDALVAARGGRACCVRVADCVPILLADRVSGAVAAVHAGWRGVAADIVGLAVAALRRAVAREVELVAAIGPHISTAAFEVGDDVATILAGIAPERAVVQRSPLGRPHVDLGNLVRVQLERAGVASDDIDDVPGCTVADADRFFSYRRDGARSGRHLAAIVSQG